MTMQVTVKTTISAALFLFSTIAFAQENIQEEYANAIDYIKCKCIEIVYASSLNCEQDINSAKVNDYSVRHPRTGSLIKELDGLKREDVTGWSKEKIANLLSADIFDRNNREKYPNIYTFSTNRNRHQDGTITGLSSSIADYVERHIAAQYVAQPDDTVVSPPLISPSTAQGTVLAVDDGDVIDGGQGGDHSFFSFQLNIAHLLLAALVLGVALYFIGKLKALHAAQIDQLRNELSEKATALTVADLDSRFAAFKEKLEKARKRKLAAKEAGLRQHIPESTAELPVKNSPVPLPVGKIIYLSAPNRDGSFDHAAFSHTFQPAVSLYKFIIDPEDPQVAIFSFHSDNKGLQAAMNNPKTYIEPVCYEINKVFDGATAITTLKHGIAQNIDGRWIVSPENKAQVKYG